MTSTTVKPGRLPNNLIYRRLDVPPAGTLLVLALQHAAQGAVFLIVAVTVARIAGLSADESLNFLALSMAAGGIGCILQALAWRGIGSGYLLSPKTTTIMLPATAPALALGGLPLLLGMTVYAGAATALLSRLVVRLRPLFPPEIAGFVVLMVGLSVVVLAMANFLGVDMPERDVQPSILLAGAVLAVMVALNVWGSKQLRLFSSLLGIVFGCFAAYAIGAFAPADLDYIVSAPWVSLPQPFAFGLAFDAALIVPFTIAALATALNAVGAITAAQKVEDPAWKRPELKSIGGGIFAEGLTNVAAGLLGGYGQASSSAAVGLSQATGANCRVISFVLGGLLIFFAFLPKAGALLLAIPAPVGGAALTFVGCFLVMSAIQMIASRMLDSRKIFVLGIAFSLGVAGYAFPQHFKAAPGWLQPWVGSPLSISVTAAILLNLLFRIGIYQRNAMTIDSGNVDRNQLAEFIARQGALWGAPQGLVYRSEIMTIEAVETLTGHGFIQASGDSRTGSADRNGSIEIATRFDEFSLTVFISYRGILLEPLREQPDMEDVVADDGQLLLARWLIGRAADRAKAERRGDLCVLTLTLGN